MKRPHLFALAALLVLTGCESLGVQTPSWLGGAQRVIKRAPGERIDVIFNASRLTPDTSAAEVAIDIPEQTNLDQWASLNAAMAQVPHLGLTGVTQHDSARIGDGNSFHRSLAASPVATGGLVIAMDAAGIVSAHPEADIGTTRWVNSESLREDVNDVGGGGLAVADGTVYATTGTGGLRAIALDSGKVKWSVNVGAPVHGAPAVGSGIVAVLTADNQTVAVDATTGAPRWTHRGIREVAGYFAITAPVISEGVVVSAYSSGELFALRAESGNVIWSDTLGSTIKTRASAVFSGIDHDPVVAEGVVVVLSASGEMQASALKNGRPLWQKRIGGHSTPWSAGNAMFVLSDTHDVAAILKRDGAIRWAQSLAVMDTRDPTRDVTPALYGPILAGNAVFVLDAKGVLSAFKPQSGERLGTYELADDPITAPIVANGSMYFITRDARLHRYH